MLKQYVYSILIISNSKKFNEALKPFLPPAVFEQIVFESSISQAYRTYEERFFDIVIINSPVLDDIGLDFAYEIVRSNSSAILIAFSDPAILEHKMQLLIAGIFTLMIPASPKVIRQTIEDLIAHRQRLKKYDAKVTSVEEKMQQIRHVNQAKLLLVEHESLSESQAHHYIEKNAMNSHVSKEVIALQIIHKYS